MFYGGLFSIILEKYKLKLIHLGKFGRCKDMLVDEVFTLHLITKALKRVVQVLVLRLYSVLTPSLIYTFVLPLLFTSRSYSIILLASKLIVIRYFSHFFVYRFLCPLVTGCQNRAQVYQFYKLLVLIFNNWDLEK